MPTISQRAVDMPASPIRRLVPFAERAVQRGVEIFHLNIGQPDLKAPQEFWNGLAQLGPNTVVAYTHSAGIASLREKTRARYARKGIDLTEHELLVTTAGSEALSFAMQATMNPGDEIIVPEPLYANYIGFSTQADAKIVPITTRIEDDFRLPSIEQFAERIGPKTKAILICNPNNPTGTVYSDEQLEQLRELCLRHDLFLIADEVYREFNYTGVPVRSVLQLEGMEQHAIMVDSVSKLYSLCGARIGFIASRNLEVMQAALKFAQARLSSPMIEQMAVEAAADTPQSYFDDVRAEYQRRRDVLREEIAEIEGALCPQIDGAFYATVRLPIDDSDKFCQWMLESFAHQGKTVMMAPATGFYETPGLGLDEVRIAYVLNEDRLRQAMRILKLGLAEYPGRTCEQKLAVGS